MLYEVKCQIKYSSLDSKSVGFLNYYLEIFRLYLLPEVGHSHDYNPEHTMKFLSPSPPQAENSQTSQLK